MDASDLSSEVFSEKYAHRGQPLVVVNATADWPAMETFGFEFFRDLYEDLSTT